MRNELTTSVEGRSERRVPWKTPGEAHELLRPALERITGIRGVCDAQNLLAEMGAVRFDGWFQAFAFPSLRDSVEAVADTYFGFD